MHLLPKPDPFLCGATVMHPEEVRRFEAWQEEGLLLIGEGIRSRKKRDPVKYAQQAGYCGA